MNAANSVKRILLISYSFAPNGIVGAKRMSELSCQFKRFGIVCDVITTEDRYAGNLDYSLKHGANIIHQSRILLPPNHTPARNLLARVVRRLSSIMRDLLFRYDTREGWKYFAIREGKRVVNNHNYDFIIVTGPPFSSFLAAEIIADESRIPLILDYRDPWTGFNWRNCSTTHAIEAEKRILSKARAAIFCTDSIRQSYIEHFHSCRNMPTAVITNGYYPYNGEITKPEEDSINIVHAGTLYGERSLSVLIEPLRIIADHFPQTIRIHHWGNPEDCEKRIFSEAGMSDRLRVHSRLPHSELMPYLGGADVLFVPSGSDVTYALPYKIFDYMATGNPILALTPSKSELRSFIESYGIGYTASMDDPVSISAALLKSIAAETKSPPDELSWQTLGNKYLSFIDGI